MGVELAARQPDASGDPLRFTKDRIGYGNRYFHESSMTPTYHRVKSHAGAQPALGRQHSLDQVRSRRELIAAGARESRA